MDLDSSPVYDSAGVTWRDGLQIVGPRFADSLVMRAGAAFLDAKPFQCPMQLGTA
jgi:hypothetical protein